MHIRMARKNDLVIMRDIEQAAGDVACAENSSVQVRGVDSVGPGSGLRRPVRRGNGHGNEVVAA